MNKTEKRLGLTAGISLIIMAVAAGFSYGYVHSSLLTDSPYTTLDNLAAGRSLFFAGLAGWIIVLITDLVVAISFLRLFRSTSMQGSLITALLRITYSVLLGAAIFQLIRIIPQTSLANGPHSMEAAEKVSSYINHFDKIWSTGLIFFGVHLLGLGYLSVKSSFIPGLLGYLLYLGGLSYIFVHSSKQLHLIAPGVLTVIENILSLPMALGEILLAIWLIYKGFRNEPGNTK